MKKSFLGGVSCIFFSAFLSISSSAQFTVGAQLRTRTELRDGQGGPLSKGSKPAIFTSQRTRLSAGYGTYRLKLGLTLQDTRVWGQDASTINRTTTADNNGLLLHEAWAEIGLTDTIIKNTSLSLKIGRQELVYDDSRLLGNLDWLQQGRRHDAAVLKYRHNSWNFHAGGAFSQNKENASGTTYNPVPPGNYPANTNGAQQYKSLEFLHINKQAGAGSISFLFLADQFSKYTVDSLLVKKWEAGSPWNRITTGLYVNYPFSKNNITAAVYYQKGKNGDGKAVDGALFSAAYQRRFAESFALEAGVDYTTDTFDPLYGTPHKFWGTMDYFYVASKFGNNGLQDYYLKAKLKKNTKWNVSLDLHQFYSSSGLTFGTETDLTMQYNLTKAISFEGGYSYFNSTAQLAAAKNITDAQHNNHWAYLMINIRPEIFIK